MAAAPGPEYQARVAAGNAPDRGGLTRAGRALQKHGGRDGSAFPNPRGDPSSINRQAQEVLEAILGHSQSFHRPNRFGGIDVFAPHGRARVSGPMARWWDFSNHDKHRRELARDVPAFRLGRIAPRHSHPGLCAIDWNLLFETLGRRGDVRLTLPSSEPGFFTTPDAFSAHNPGLAVHLMSDGINLKCDVVAPELIEFDLDPREIEDSERWTTLLRLMRAMATTLAKAVLLTEEGGHEAVLLEVTPSGRGSLKAMALP